MSQTYSARYAALVAIRQHRAARRKQQQEARAAHRQAVQATVSEARAEAQTQLSAAQHDRQEGRGAREKRRKALEKALKTDRLDRQKSVQGLLKESVKKRRADGVRGRADRLETLQDLARTRSALVAVTKETPPKGAGGA